MMNNLVCGCILLVGLLSVSAQKVKYGGRDKDTKFHLAAILPLRESCENGAKVDPEGIAIAEALEFAIDTLTKANVVQGLTFEALDGCNSVKQRRALAYELVKQPPDMVLSQFKKEDLQMIKIFANEKVPQISYVADNALLSKDDSITNEDIKFLASAFPEESNKMKAVAALIEDELDFDHVHMVGSDDQHGRSGLKLLAAELGTGTCSDPLYISDDASIKEAIEKIQENELIRAVVVHTSGSLERELYTAVEEANITDLIFISTNNWKSQVPTLKEHAKATEGLIFVNLDDRLEAPYGVHIQNVKRPFVQKKWLEDLYEELGGNDAECYKPATFKDDAPTNVQYCNQAQQSVQDKLLAERQVTKIVIDAVYAIANAIKDRDGSETLLDSLENVNFKSDMTGSQINYQNRAMLSNNYEFHQLQESGSGDTDSQLIGSWKPANEPKMEFDESSLKFKDGSTKIPLSACSAKCLPGTYRKYPEGGDKCCWTCTECDDGLITNTSNADVCLTCQQGFTALPNKTNCAEYNLVFFHWFSPMGQFMIFMMVVGICLTLFALGILSQNSDHIVVKLGGYKLMSCYLLGCTLLMLSPIAILIEPSTTTCSSFIGVFSIGVTIPLAVLTSKAALITENLYDPEGDLIKNTLGRRPRALVILIVLCAQVAVVIIGSLLSPPQIRHTESDRWDWKYAECANTKSASFWAPFFFNIFLGVLVNVMSCGAKRINDNFGELRNVCVTTLLFFLACLIHAILIFKLLNMNLMEGQALISVVYGLFFLVGFMFPKVHVILFEVVNEEEEVAIANAGETNDGDD